MRAAAVVALILIGSLPGQALADQVDLEAARQQFVKSCGTCHSVEPGAKPRQGPNLHGVFGRRVGQVERYAYSEALAAGDWAWTEDALDPWLGEARWKQSQGRVTFGYRFLSEDVPAIRLSLKVEINTREHFAVLDFTERPFSVESRWYSGQADITTFELDELLATKMRALYQRRKGRDLFDLAMGDTRSNPGRIAAAFREYMDREGGPVTRSMFERNLAGKIDDAQFNADMSALLRPGFEWRPAEAARTVSEQLISLLPGEPWKRETEAGDPLHR